MATELPSCPETNRLLVQFPTHDWKALVKESQTVFLNERTPLFHTGEMVDKIFFPLDCVVSLLAGGGRGEPKIEGAMIGDEGAVGAVSLLGNRRAVGDYVVQVPGHATVVAAGSLLELAERSPGIRDRLQRYTYCLLHQVLHSSACHQLHTMEQRCARWLLMTHDRAHRDTFRLTQEALSEMFAVRRATVNLAIGTLRAAGFITYVRGQLTVLNREGLKRAACACYGIIADEYRRAGLS